MTAEERKEAFDYINNQLEWGYLDLGTHEDCEIEIIKEAIHALGCLDQYKWERDIAIAQLKELGIGFGEKVDGVYLTKEEHEKLLEHKWKYENLCEQEGQ